jgi:hypothetical protein
MKKVFFTLAFAAFGIVAANAQAPATPQAAAQPAAPTHPSLDDKTAPRFQFIGGETHDFGTLKEGPEATYVFKFKNVGKQPLIITNASASCGCTVPVFEKSPVLPGKTGEIKVTYNTAGRGGQPFNKTVFITSNAASEKPTYEIFIKGTVAPATTAAAPAKG